jgi:hypothetical protein
LFSKSSIENAMVAAGFRAFRIFSSVRDANGAFIGSVAIRNKGSFSMNAPTSVTDKILGRLFQSIELTLCSLSLAEGEDLVVLAARD